VGNSLQDQLLKAGLVNKQKLKQAKSAKRKRTKQTGGKDPNAAEQHRRAEQAAAEKARRDRELNRQRQEETKRKARENELRQLIHAHRVLRGEGDVAYNFQDGGHLKRIYVTADQQRGLAAGRLGLVRQDAGYELLPLEIAEKIAGRNPALILVLNRPGENIESAPEEDDEYAAYKVPDDLMW
jgi:uncharacterized protein YaiL (DUF2058 family)